MLTDYGKQNQSTNPCPSFRGTYTSRTIAKIRMAVTNCSIFYSSIRRMIFVYHSTSVCFNTLKFFFNLINFCTFTSYCPNISPGICNIRQMICKIERDILQHTSYDFQADVTKMSITYSFFRTISSFQSHYNIKTSSTVTFQATC